MALNDVKFNVLNGGLGKAGKREDATSCLVFSIMSSLTGIDSITKFDNADHAEQWINTKVASGDLILKNPSGGSMLYPVHMIIAFLISDFFRMNPNATLYLSLHNFMGMSTLEDTIVQTQLFANGSIRQFGIIAEGSPNTYNLGIIEDAFISLDEEHRPSICLISAPSDEDTAGYTSGGSLLEYVDTNDLKGKYLSMMIGGSNELKNAIDSNLPIFPAIGCVLGLISLVKVSESIAWVEKCNMMTEDRGFLIGILKKLHKDKVNELSLINWYVEPVTTGGAKLTDFTDSQLSVIQDKGYIFPRKHVGIDGTYMSEAFTLDERTSDYSKIQYIRTMQKCTRVLRNELLPKLNSPIRVEPSTGEIASDVIAYFEGLCDDALAVMNAADEISGAAVQVMPNLEDDTNTPGQKKLVIKQKIVPFGSADVIENNIGFAVKI